MTSPASATPTAPAVEPPATKGRKAPVWGIISLKAGENTRIRFADIAGMWTKVWLVKVFTEGEAHVLVGDEIELARLLEKLAPRIAGGCKLVFGTEEMSVSNYMANTNNLIDSILVYCPYPVWLKMKKEQGSDLNFRQCRRMPR